MPPASYKEMELALSGLKSNSESLLRQPCRLADAAFLLLYLLIPDSIAKRAVDD